jgi:hypothetical protein
MANCTLGKEPGVHWFLILSPNFGLSVLHIYNMPLKKENPLTFQEPPPF